MTFKLCYHFRKAEISFGNLSDNCFPSYCFSKISLDIEIFIFYLSQLQEILAISHAFSDKRPTGKKTQSMFFLWSLVTAVSPSPDYRRMPKTSDTSEDQPPQRKAYTKSIIYMNPIIREYCYGPSHMHAEMLIPIYIYSSVSHRRKIWISNLTSWINVYITSESLTALHIMTVNSEATFGLCYDETKQTRLAII